ncbi:MAG: polysaccharide deacetylase family protein [Candidatus Bathyarchaeia archaeon]|jgi:peptidoglycan/xylan/chitin deacetylase (PgdA/CDA1 family)
MFIVSIDVDAGSRKLGLINKGKNDANVHKYFSEYRVGEVEESTVPMLVETFDRVEIPVTFAVRGQLTEVNGSVLEMLLDSTVKHDIGAHGYYHTEFTGLSSVEAEKELAMISTGLKKYGIVPRSFVFPRNKVAHLDLLARHGYKCYRGYGNFLKDCMYIEKTGKLYNIHPSLYLEKGARLTYLKGILDACVAKKLPFHAWFHPWSFGETKECVQKIINKVFIPFFSYAQVKRKSNLLDFETMYSAALKVENMKNDTAS